MNQNRIQVLPRALAERIAAGEVVERPASVVKELVENALDAKATRIQVRLEEGGKNLIEVLDNGSGILPEDLPLAVQRHATSKLHALEDLERILTLGFRGEALPSIAAVGELEILSRSASVDPQSPAFLLSVGESWKDLSAFSQLKAQPVAQGTFLQTPHGTRIQVRGLFSQIPARLKFLKSQRSEVAHTREWLERLALCYPLVHFEFWSQDQRVLNLQPCVSSEDPSERLLEILGEGNLTLPVRFAKNAEETIQVRWIEGLSVKSTHKLIQSVNHRPVKDRLLQQAVLQGFRQALLPGQFPALLLEIHLPPTALDVNVHPAKTELRFLEPQVLFHHIEKVVQSLFQPVNRWYPGEQEPASVFAQVAQPPPSLSLPPRTQAPRSSSSPLPRLATTTATAMTTTSFLSEPDLFKGSDFRGVLFETYCLFSTEKEFLLIDLHAAHERIRYENLRKSAFEMIRHPQKLLLPIALSLPEEKKETLLPRLAWLEQLGFETRFSDSPFQLWFEALPSGWEESKEGTPARLLNLIDRVLEAPMHPESPKALLLDQSLFETLASEACHSSVRSGTPLRESEARLLVRQLFETEHPWNCPHGRPTCVRFSEAQVKAWFLRS